MHSESALAQLEHAGSSESHWAVYQCQISSVPVIDKRTFFRLLRHLMHVGSSMAHAGAKFRDSSTSKTRSLNSSSARPAFLAFKLHGQDIEKGFKSQTYVLQIKGLRL